MIWNDGWRILKTVAQQEEADAEQQQQQDE